MGRIAFRVSPFLILLMMAAVQGEDKPTVTWNPAYSGNYTVASNRTIKYVIIHTVEGSYTGCINWFKNPAASASAHYVVSHGGAITQMVADKDIAWHAGNWTYNQQSIGIEHEGYAYQNTWTDAQYRASAKLTRWLCLTYGIPMERSNIIAHKDVPYPNNHTDPGPYFNWDYYLQLVRTAPTPPPATTTNQAMTVTTDVLNVRSGPGTNYSIIGTIPMGQTYIATGSSNGWYKIWYKNNAGWCHGAYLQKVTGVLACKITGSVVNVRDGVNYAPVVGQVSLGQIYHRTASYGDWIHIHWGGGRYWIHRSLQTTIGY
jgi:N-acetyl-anhydromuramyl-L-alanine amidase AmpD